MSKKLKALIIGENFQLVFGAILALKRAGFEIDVISSNKSFLKSKLIKNCEIVDIKEMSYHALKKNLAEYDLISVGSDQTLNLILESKISDELKLKLLPVLKIKNFSHITSKIGLSQTLFANNVATPDFAVVKNVHEAINMANAIGYPILLKTDFSGGGHGIIECNNQEEIEKIGPYYFRLPVLLQKKIIGKEFDLSAFYQDGKLIHFHYCEIKKVIGNKFGISSVRKYFQPSEIEEKIFRDLVDLGTALGANGFVTISYIKSDDGRGYFIEADMRANSWADFTKFIGDDAALKISNYFQKGEILKYPIDTNNDFPKEMIIPYWLRLSFLEILFNRYNVWKFIPRNDLSSLFDNIYREILIPKIKKCKRIPTHLIRIVIPKREDRIKIRNYFKERIIARQ